MKYVPEHGHVVVRICSEARGLTLTVSDDSPGIEADLRMRIFDRFWRGSHRDTPGSGLGLAIVQQAVERLGARINVESGLDGRGVASTRARRSRALASGSLRPSLQDLSYDPGHA